MFYILSLLAGMMISVMVVFNGGLNARAGMAMALVTIHVVGLLFISLTFLIKKEKPRLKKLPLWLFTGGLIGILTTIFNNTAFGHISVSAMMALSLLGESVSGLLADHFGLIGLPVRRFRPEKLWGGLLALIGIVWMLNLEFQPLPVLVSLLAGVAVLFSRLINSRLAGETGIRTSAWCNYVAGLLGALLLLLFTKSGPAWSFALSGPYYLYLGGALGAVIVLLSNHIVGKISSLYMSLAIFVGQVSASLLLDMLLTKSFPAQTTIGGLFVLGGLVINLMQDRNAGMRNRQAV
jgi:bacterial/archaeal transporter family-2 protein